MKNRALLFLFALIMSTTANSVFAASSEKPVFVSEKDTTQNSIVCYEVYGMDCPGCQSALEKQVKKIDGVADAKASFKEKQVIVELKAGANVSEEEIEKRIKKANFTPGKKIEPAKNEE
ncbi:MAG TPA: heavy metal-associated domain-containing protein [Prolixibacteraceae bacterium]|nr:heavy metal-associated domain-containing protein [Prolixibacteraceae bacterium]